MSSSTSDVRVSNLLRVSIFLAVSLINCLLFGVLFFFVCGGACFSETFGELSDL